MYLEHFRDACQCVRYLVEPALGDLGGDERRQRIAQRLGTDPAFERVQSSVLFQPEEPGLGGIARDARLVRQPAGGRTGVPGEFQQEACVDGIDRPGVGHRAHHRPPLVPGDRADCSISGCHIVHKSSTAFDF